MPEAVYRILKAAFDLVENMTPEERQCLAMISSAGAASMAQLRMRALVIAVEQANTLKKKV